MMCRDLFWCIVTIGVALIVAQDVAGCPRHRQRHCVRPIEGQSVATPPTSASPAVAANAALGGKKTGKAEAEKPERQAVAQEQVQLSQRHADKVPAKVPPDDETGRRVVRLLHELSHVHSLGIGDIETFFYSPAKAQELIDADLARLGTKAVPGLIEALKDSDEFVRYIAAGRLGKLRDPRAFEPLVAALKDKEAIVQYWAVSALGDLGDRRAVDVLIPLLQSKVQNFRQRAAEALGQIGDKRAYSRFCPFLKDKEFIVRDAANGALKKIKDKK